MEPPHGSHNLYEVKFQIPITFSTIPYALHATVGYANPGGIPSILKIEIICIPNSGGDPSIS
jgi:hypothetical protein